MQLLIAFFLLFTPPTVFATAFPEELTASPNIMMTSYQVPPHYLDIHRKIQNLFEDELKGQSLELVFAIQNSAVNASASRQGDTWYITFYGGLLRHPRFNENMFLITYCHELGHHLAGAPLKFPGHPEHGWISAEGQSDYFATHICMKRYYASQGLQSTDASIVANEILQGCTQADRSSAEQNICIQSARVAEARAQFHYALTKDRRGKSRFSYPTFHTPSRDVVGSTLTTHPSPQCRLDTYFQGALCTETQGKACVESFERFSGARPRCWFRP